MRGVTERAQKKFSSELRLSHAHCSLTSDDSGGAVQLAGHPVPGRKAFCCEMHCFPSSRAGTAHPLPAPAGRAL